MLKFFLGIGLKIKLYAAAAAAALVGAGLLILKGQSIQKNKRMKERLEGMKKKQEVQKDVQSHTDDELIDGITKNKR